MECLIQDAEKRIIIMITKTTRTKIKEHYSAKKPKFTWAFFYVQMSRPEISLHKLDLLWNIEIHPIKSAVSAITI